MSRIHNELSQVIITIKPLNPQNQSYIPVTLRYKVNDCLTGTELVAYTSVTPTSREMEITIPGSVNAIINTRLRNPEKKVVTINTDNGLATQHYSEYIYRVKNLSFVTSTDT